MSGREPLETGLLWLGGYLFGGIPVGWIVGRIAGVDLRRVGDGKIGTSNLFHSVGLLPAAVAGPLQFVQGFLPVLAADLLGLPDWVAAGTGLAAVVGNGWPIYFRYNGGRGVAAATGAVTLWSWPGFGYVLFMLGAGGAVRRSALGVLLAYAGLPVVVWLTAGRAAYAVTAVGVVICLVLRRFEGYHFGRRREGSPPDDWRQRLINDRPARIAPSSR